MYTVHASIDNNSDKIRISTDSRYQPVSRPADERWIGEKPLGHSYEIKRGQDLLTTLVLSGPGQYKKGGF